MPFEVISTVRADILLKSLLNLREKLIYEISREEVAGDIEERSLDRFITKLAEVQTCIAATREYLKEK